MHGSGLSFKKLDLHIHTPASQDFQDKSVTPEQIVETALAKGLDAIAITDHNTGEWIDRVKAAASKKGLVVFPGVEISCRDGTGGIHLIALFDVDKATKHVEGLLEKLDITSVMQGKTESLVSKQLSITQVIDIIQSELRQGIAIPAHVTSSKGILQDIRGNPRIDVVQHPGLIAVESPDFQNEEKKKKKKRAVDLLDGNDPDYNVKLAVYQASDNPSGTDKGGHGLAGIGCRCAHFKMEKVNLDSLRQCFLDPDVRIVQDFEFAPEQYPRIDQVVILGGFLDKQTIEFNEGLNSIIGGKGTGKSLLVELLRFALDQAPSIDGIVSDHNSKLEKRLQKGGMVEITFTDGFGKTVVLRRTFDPTGNRFHEANGEPSQLYPIMFLSQNEIIKIAQDPIEQLAFIDRFLDFRFYRNKIEALEKQLKIQDTSLAESIRAVGERTEIQRRLNTNTVELERLSTQLSDPIFEEYEAASQKNQTLGSQVSRMEEIRQALEDARLAISSVEESGLPEDAPPDPPVEQNQVHIRNAKSSVIAQLDRLLLELGRFRQPIEETEQNWRDSFERIQTRYDEHVRSEGGDYQELAGTKDRLQQQQDSMMTQLHQADAKNDKLSAAMQDRNTSLDALTETYDAFRIERKKRCDYFQTSSEGKLELIIERESDRNEYRSRLLNLKVHSRLREPDIDSIVDKCTPRYLVQQLLTYWIAQFSESIEDGFAFLTELAQRADLEIDKIQKLASVLIEEDKLEELLELQYRAYPQDRPEIRYCVGDDKYVALDELSVGQKCTALLIMALTDGDMPVVIDQPEDSLDIRSIWLDICSKVRTRKGLRQFVFTTHNSNIAVASDSDNYIILDADSEHGWVEYTGSMDHTPVDDQVLDYMEGGTDPYGKKFRKYRADRRPDMFSH